MADLCFSVSSLSQYYYGIVCSYSSFLYLINISLLLVPLIYHNFTPRLSEPASTFFLLALIYDIFTPRLSGHGSGFVVSTYYSDILSPEFTEEVKEFENVFLLDETSSFDVVESSKVTAYEPVSEEIHDYLEDVRKIVEAEEEESKLRTKQGVEGNNINDRCDDGNEYGKTSAALCVKSRDDSVESSCINGGGYGSNFRKHGYTGQEEEWKNTLAWKLFEERHYNVVERDEDMDSLWESFETDSIKSRHIDLIVKKKDIKKKSGELDKNNSNEDDNNDEVEMRSGCLQGLKCCSAGVGKKNMRRGRSGIVKITKPLKLIHWWCHLKRNAKIKIFLI